MTDPPKQRAPRELHGWALFVEPITDFGETVQKSLKAFAWVVGVAYVVGYMVVSIHLLRWGAEPLSFARPQFVLAGAWLALPFVLAATTAYLSQVGGVRGRILGGALCVGLLAFAVDGGVLNVKRMFVSSTLALLLAASACTALLVTVPYVVRLFKGADDASSAAPAIPRGLGAVVCGVSFVVYVIAFSRSIYPSISVVMGGGELEAVRLYAKTPTRERLEGLGYAVERSDAGPAVTAWLVAADNSDVVLASSPDSSDSVTVKTGDVLSLARTDSSSRR